MRSTPLLRGLLAALAIVASSAALAHPQLLSSTPADNAEVAAPPRIELVFSEHLLPESSAARLVMTEMPGMAMDSPMKMAFKVTAGPDGKTMVITPTQPLPPGTYRLDWRAVSSDTHPVTGHMSFQVK
ncbi:copper homeostasis periplasmic binding protein CopC [Ramlibacter ginsenosidimutans]|uniref:Copper homeostasis periplasmic binding protein CopC n=1 Tax=Ramlibacter ginsenosidimutans TaxID=502333 RepID=A0A934WKV0_9BURK|nr:copper homeostasis periplasmic binding protein CopC [Ramlibacter ginsenosidimutans]MBK6004743.1 copper homeostasis periplasmic binding protein CopC [Ramlibacter ginsenosidimutans]